MHESLFNDMSTVVDHSVLSPREMEKRTEDLAEKRKERNRMVRKGKLNPCHAEHRYTLPLQTV